MSDLPNPRRAERMQAAKRQYLPRVWPLLLAIVILVLIAIWTTH